MKDIPKEPEVVVISVNPETTHHPEEDVVSEKKEDATEAAPSSNDVAASDTPKPEVAQVDALSKNEPGQEKPRGNNAPSEGANEQAQ